MKRVLTLTLMVCLIVSMAGMAFARTPGVTDDEIKIGSFMALSGPLAFIGTPLKNGMQAYFKEVNANGGINGRKITLIAEDDQFMPAKTVAAVRKMVERDRVFGIVGGLGTPGGLAVKDYLVRRNVPFVYPASGATEFSFPPKENIFVVQPNYRTEGKVIAKFLRDEFADKKIAFIHDDTEIGKEGARYTTENMENYGLEPVADISFPGANVDFSSYVLKLKEAGAEVVVFHGVMGPAAQIRKEAKKIGYDFEMIVNYALADPLMFQLAGDAWNGVYATGWLPPLDAEEAGVNEFFTTYNKHFPEGGGLAYAAAGWVAAEVFCEAVERMGDDVTREELYDALESFDNWNGVLARNISYSAVQRSGVTEMMLLKAKDGQYVPASDWYDGSY